jgi:hypothetical protein
MGPQCKKCEKTESILWRKDSESGEICNECFESEKVEPKVEPEEVEVKIEKESSKEKELPVLPAVPEAKVRKSTRSTRFKTKVTRQKSTGKTSRRSNTFKNGVRPNKTPNNISAETKTKSAVFHDGFYFQVGDIVSVMCRGKKYYAQIRGLVVDTFMEKSACLSWLIPTTSSPDPNEAFDPQTYLIGLEEDIPRRIANTMEYVMTAPSSYFISRSEPYGKPVELADNLYEKSKKSFIWTNV